VIGVQWHAECLVDRHPGATLFNAFVEAAGLFEAAAARFARAA
jgi:gamma-glutamyl-gamma-aminobutyrate hydrolase PuuD